MPALPPSDPDAPDPAWGEIDFLLKEHQNQAGSPEADQHRLRRMELYDNLNRSINDLRFGRFAFFLNYGYVPDEHPSHAIHAPGAGDPDVNSRRLVLELIGDCPIDGRDILDVSCGRGAVAVILQAHFQPGSYLGVDLSSEAVAFCGKHHERPGYRFAVGDAQSLPVEDGCCDVLINLEASHNYPHIGDFFQEVSRVLRPGGWLLYSDLMAPDALERNERRLLDLGFTKTLDQDITSNVLLSCKVTGERRLKVYKEAKERDRMAHFLAAPGSQTYRAMEQGVVVYRLYRFLKP